MPQLNEPASARIERGAPARRRLTRRSVWLFVGALLATGCTDPKRFDPQMRARCFDTAWSALENGHADLAAVQRARDVRETFRRQVIDAPTRREYIVALARFLATFDDVHLGFDDLDAYWETREGAPLVSLIWSGVWVGGRIWVEFTPAAAAMIGAAGSGEHRVDRFYELVAVDGVPADRLGALPLVFSLLRGAGGASAAVTLRVGGAEQTCVIPFAPPPTSAPADAIVAPIERRASPSRPAPAAVASRRLEADIGYIWLGDLTSDATVEAFHKALDGLLDARALILDLRDNHGGTRGPIEAVLSRFVPGVHSYASAQARVPRLLPIGAANWWLEFRGYVWGREPIFRQPLVVLIDATTLSSAEILASSLRELCGAVLVGERTIGAGAAVATVTLPDGLTIRYGAYLIRQRDGRAFQGAGIEPDVSVPVDLDAVRRDGRGAVRRWAQLVALTGYAQARSLIGEPISLTVLLGPSESPIELR